MSGLLCALFGHPGWLDESARWEWWWPPRGPKGIHKHGLGRAVVAEDGTLIFSRVFAPNFIGRCIRCRGLDR